MHNRNELLRKITRLGLLAAVAVALSFLESLIPPVPGLPPGVRLGLSNIAVMFGLEALGKKQALGLAVCKSGFALLTRGATAGFLSLAGGFCSLAVMSLLTLQGGDVSGRKMVSVCGGVSHNLGQLLAAYWLLNGNFYLIYYLPVLVISGVVMGWVNAVLLKTVLPPLKKLLPTA